MSLMVMVTGTGKVWKDRVKRERWKGISAGENGKEERKMTKMSLMITKTSQEPEKN